MSTASAMGDEMMTASSTATAMMDEKLPGTGGPSPVIALIAGLMLMGYGVAAFSFVRRATS